MITFTIPLRTVSELNARDGWRARAARTRAQRDGARAYTLSRAVQLRALAGAPLAVTLVRVAPRWLDDDNLRGALKAVRDGIAEALGVDDGSDVVTWRYEQWRCKGGTGGVEVRIERRAAA